MHKKIDEAEKDFDQKIQLKILVDGQLEGWHHLDTIFQEEKLAYASSTKSNDPLFYFFTSGTTGLPKVVTHTQFTYPVGHLTTSFLGWSKTGRYSL